MKRVVYVLLLLLPAFVAPAAAAPVQYFATLSGPNEEPPNASPGTGLALVTIDGVANTMLVDVTFAGLIGNVTVSHIHVINGPGDLNTADTNGPVATTTPTFPGFPVGVTAGTYVNLLDMTMDSSYRAQFIIDAGGTTALAQQALFSAIGDGRAYLNVHSNVFPGGEIRGFLQPCPPTGPCPADVSEPMTLTLAGLALAGGLWRRRRAG